ncbi:uncharacterized protein [Penaeus vannamei]|uniref:uncharacterized protein n=1 Tax=Penaeus vannamei TaxID=6689 RepID=UPI00387FAC76
MLRQNRTKHISCKVTLESIQEIDRLRNLEVKVQNFYNKDFPENTIDDIKEMSVEDHKFLNIVEDGLKFEEGHYSMSLPFKEMNVVVPNNLEIANKRLQYLKRKLESSDKFASDYNEFMNNLIDKNFCEVVSFSEVEGQLHRTWYLPHHGPNMTANLDHVISRFRQEPVAMMADIELMFYQVKKKPIPYRMKVHIYGATSSPACANLALKKTAENNKNQYNQAVIECIECNFYIDDFLKSVSTIEEAKDIIKGLESLCKRGGFKIKDWSFNQKSLVEVVSDKTKSKYLVGIDLDKEPIPNASELGYGSVIYLRFVSVESKKVLRIIHEGSEIDEWLYIDSHFNPADASRGLFVDGDNNKIKMWFEGPEFLFSDQTVWSTPNFEVKRVLGKVLEACKRFKREPLSPSARNLGEAEKLIIFSKLMIMEIHNNLGHLGKNAILVKLREKYWILGASNLIKSVTSNVLLVRSIMHKLCNRKCQIYQNLDQYLMIHLFQSSMRAVHLEMAYDLSTNSCINCLRRFVTRRGVPKYIRSDNGTNFVGAKCEFETLSTERKGMIEHCANLGIEWEFNPPYTSHFGGVWGRLTRTANVKNTYVLARVTETLVGKDGLVRCVKLRTKDGYLERPISKLCLVLKHESKSALNLP